MPKPQIVPWAPGVVVPHGLSVPPRCAKSWGEGHRCTGIADHVAPHRCGCAPPWKPAVDHKDGDP